MAKRHKRWHELKIKHKIVIAVVVGFAIISFWRGIWGLMDLYLFPDNYALSLWVSMFLGLILLLITGYVRKGLI